MMACELNNHNHFSQHQQCEGKTALEPAQFALCPISDRVRQFPPVLRIRAQMFDAAPVAHSSFCLVSGEATLVIYFHQPQHVPLRTLPDIEMTMEPETDGPRLKYAIVRGTSHQPKSPGNQDKEGDITHCEQDLDMHSFRGHFCPSPCDIVISVNKKAR